MCYGIAFIMCYGHNDNDNEFVSTKAIEEYSKAL